MMKWQIVTKTYILFSLIILFSCNRQANESVESPKQTEPVAQTATNETNNSIEVYQNSNAEAGNSSKVRRNPFVSNPDTVIHLVKTACFGNCPVFTATILASGEVMYHGKQDVERIGHYEARIHKRIIEALDEKMMSMEFYDLNERYPDNQEEIILDAPWTYVFSENGKKRNFIAINHGAPEELRNLIYFVEREFEQLNWQQVTKKD